MIIKFKPNDKSLQTETKCKAFIYGYNEQSITILVYGGRLLKRPKKYFKEDFDSKHNSSAARK